MILSFIKFNNKKMSMNKQIKAYELFDEAHNAYLQALRNLKGAKELVCDSREKQSKHPLANNPEIWYLLNADISHADLRRRDCETVRIIAERDVLRASANVLCSKDGYVYCGKHNRESGCNKDANSIVWDYQLCAKCFRNFGNLLETDDVFAKAFMLWMDLGKVNNEAAERMFMCLIEKYPDA